MVCSVCLVAAFFPSLKGVNLLSFDCKKIFFLILAVLRLPRGMQAFHCVMCGLSLIETSGSFSQVVAHGFLLFWSMGSRAHGFSSCTVWAQ